MTRPRYSDRICHIELAHPLYNRPERLALSVSVFAQKFSWNFPEAERLQRLNCGGLGIESGNVPPNMSIKAITPPGVTG